MEQLSTRKLKIGLIGCGRVASNIHLPVLARLPQVDLVAVAEPDEQRLGLVKQKAPAARVYADYNELLRDPQVEAVVICLPTGLHASAACAAFAAGKHVYIEKPLAASLADAQRVIDVQKKAGTVGMTGFNFRFHPLYESLARELEQKRIGRVIGLRSAFCAAPRPLPAWKRSRTGGGGALLDLASHHVDLVRFLLKQPVRRVSAAVRSARSEHDTAAVTLTLADNTVCSILVSMTAAEEDTLEVYGDSGKLWVDRYGSRSLSFKPTRRDMSRAGKIRAGIDILRGLPARLRDAVLGVPEPSHERALRAFADAVLRGEASPVTIEEGWRSLAVIAATEESARSGAAVEVPQLAGDPAVAPVEDAPVDYTADAEPVEPDPGGPAMSAVVVTPENFAAIARTVRHLRDQDVVDQIELILVAPAESDLADHRPEDLEGFHSTQLLGVGPIDNVDKAAAPAIRAARAPVVSLVEDHAFPQPGWARALLEKHREPWAAVGSVFRNANPRNGLSWTNMLIPYGQWIEPASGGPINLVSRHNVCFKRAVLLHYGDELVQRLGRDGGMLGDLVSKGHRFCLEPAACVNHLNPSLLSSTIRLRYQAGRLWAAERAMRGRWGIIKRAIYTLGGPLIPAVRFVRFRRDLFTSGRLKGQEMKLYPALMLGLLLDAAGQMMGYAFGAGRSADILARFEFDRLRHLRPDDRADIEADELVARAQSVRQRQETALT